MIPSIISRALHHRCALRRLGQIFFSSHPAQTRQMTIMSPSRRVAFTEMNQLVVETNLSVGPHKHNIWFTQEEMDLFKSSAVVQINRIRSSVSKRRIQSADHIVGLEKFLAPDLTAEYKTRRDKLKKEILDEARRQQGTGCTDNAENAERLKRISAENSEWARERAQEAAKFLENDQRPRCRRRSTTNAKISFDVACHNPIHASQL